MKFVDSVILCVYLAAVDRGGGGGQSETGDTRAQLRQKKRKREGQIEIDKGGGREKERMGYHVVTENRVPHSCATK